MKKTAMLLAMLLVILSAWMAFHSSEIAIVVNGQKLVGPAKIAAEGWGVLVAVVALFCGAILLAFVFAGIGLLVLGVFVMAGLLAVWFAFPFLLPILVPLLVLWLFVALLRGGSQSKL
jgi:hypothetical protein